MQYPFMFAFTFLLCCILHVFYIFNIPFTLKLVFVYLDFTKLFHACPFVALLCSFIKQYYEILAKGPENLHKFYNEDSNFLHSDLTQVSVVYYAQTSANYFALVLELGCIYVAMVPTTQLTHPCAQTTVFFFSLTLTLTLSIPSGGGGGQWTQANPRGHQQAEPEEHQSGPVQRVHRCPEVRQQRRDGGGRRPALCTRQPRQALRAELRAFLPGNKNMRMNTFNCCIWCMRCMNE
jgi:hypothetical protein